jgi:hypothetical protein
VRFERFLGIDYSGAETAETGLSGLRVYAAWGTAPPEEVGNPTPGVSRARRWSRRDLAYWLRDQLGSPQPVLVGIDHCFSFPLDYFTRYGLTSWQHFLDDFREFWPTDRPGCSVNAIRTQTWWDGRDRPAGERVGTSGEFRLCERWTSSAKSAFQFDMQGSVAKSTHAGLPWLCWLRATLGDRVHWWPFDGWAVPEGKSVVAEVYPSIFRNRYERAARTGDQQDAYAVARWLGETCHRGALEHYFCPPLTGSEQEMARLEGWILGIF